jgi:hypothetical protein
VKIEFDQVCAIVIFLVCALLMYLGIDGEVKTTMTLAVGFLIGAGVKARTKSKRG